MKDATKPKHLTAFAVTRTARGQSLKAVILCGKRLTINVDYTNDPDGDHTCADCKRRMDHPQSGIERRPHPMLVGKKCLVFAV